MGNNVILTQEEVDVRNQRRRAEEQWGGPTTDDTRSQEDWRAQVRKQVNRMVDLDNDPGQSPDPYFDQYVMWQKVAQLSLDAMASINRKRTQFAAAPKCMKAPPGWQCTRACGHEGPCAAVTS